MVTRKRLSTRGLRRHRSAPAARAPAATACRMKSHGHRWGPGAAGDDMGRRFLPSCAPSYIQVVRVVQVVPFLQLFEIRLITSYYRPPRVNLLWQFNIFFARVLVLYFGDESGPSPQGCEGPGGGGDEHGASHAHGWDSHRTTPAPASEMATTAPPGERNGG